MNDSQVIKELPSPFIDERGSIQNLFYNYSGSCVVIESKKGTQRANHYHKEDYHYCYLISGGILYFERPVGSKDIPQKYDITPGTMFYTGPMLEHCMFFTEDSVFLTFGGDTREQHKYEDDLVRIPSLYEEYFNEVK